jgi:hypothetical protein
MSSIKVDDASKDEKKSNDDAPASETQLNAESEKPGSSSQVLAVLPSSNNSAESFALPEDGRITIKGDDLKILFSKRPELIELLVLELKALENDESG